MKWALPLVFTVGASATCIDSFSETEACSLAVKLLDRSALKLDLKSINQLILARVFPVCWKEIKLKDHYVDLRRKAQELPLVSKIRPMSLVADKLEESSKKRFIEWVTELFSDFSYPSDNFLRIDMVPFLGDNTMDPIRRLSEGIQKILNSYNPQMMVAMPNLDKTPFFTSIGHLQNFTPDDHFNPEISQRIVDIYGQFLSYGSIFKETRKIGYVPLGTSGDTENRVVASFRECPTCSSMIWPIQEDDLWNLAYIEGWNTKESTIVFVELCPPSKVKPTKAVERIKKILGEARKALRLHKCKFKDVTFVDHHLSESKDDLIYDMMQYMKFLTLGNRPDSLRVGHGFLKGQDRKDLILAELFIGRQFIPAEYATYYED